MTQIGYHGIYYQYYHLNNDTWYLIRALFSMVGYRLFLRSSNKREVHSFLGKRTFLSEYNHFVIFLRRYQLYQVMSNL